MKRFSWLAALLGLAVLVALSGISRVTAAPQAQLTPFPTPTPGPDGRILYVVQPGDTLWRIAAVSGLTLEELRSFNNLSADDPIVEGQTLLLGLGGPSEAQTTPGPAPTPTPVLPTPEVGPGSGMICVLLFEDVNGDAFRQEEEMSVPGGAVSITDRAGSVSLTETTSAGAEPDCFEDLPPGAYNISVAIPDGYNPTTLLNFPVELEAGSETYLDFGAQLSSEALAEAPPPVEGGRSPLLGILGALLLLGGLGLGLFAGRMRRQRPV